MYPFYLTLVKKYKLSPYANGVLNNHIEVNPKTDCSGLTDESDVSFVPMTNVQEKTNVVSYDSVKYKTVKKGFTVFQRDDLIWAKITPCMQNGKSCIVGDMPTEIGFGSTEFHVLRKRNEKIYMPFVWAILSNENVLKAAQATFSGSAGQQRVSASFIENFPAVLPEYSMQVRLVAELEEKLSLLNSKLRQADEVLAGMSSYILLTLNIAPIRFDSQLCCKVKMSDIVSDKTFSAEYYHPERMAAISNMKDACSSNVRKLIDIVDFCRDIVSCNESSLKYLGLAGVESQTGELSGVEEDAAGQAFKYEIDDVLYGRLRPYLNKVIRAEEPGICSTEFHVMRVKDQTTILPEYLAAIMRSNLILSQTKHMMTGNTHPRISNDDVQNLYVPVPDISIQKAIVNDLTERRIKARQLKQEAEQEWFDAKAQFEKELLGE